jgi:hypothetical protein
MARPGHHVTYTTSYDIYIYMGIQTPSLENNEGSQNGRACSVDIGAENFERSDVMEEDVMICFQLYEWRGLGFSAECLAAFALSANSHLVRDAGLHPDLWAKNSLPRLGGQLSISKLCARSQLIQEHGRSRFPYDRSANPVARNRQEGQG